MEFKKFRKIFSDNFGEITKGVNHLYVVNLDKDAMWDLYLNSFPEGTNKMYRERREFDCSCCRHFMKNFGNVVIIKDNVVTTIWDFDANSTTYQPVIDALNAFVKAHLIAEVYATKFNRIGVESNLEQLETKEILEWDHLCLDLPTRFVDKTIRTIPDIQGEFKTIRNVFFRSLSEITEDSINTVLELISQNSLHRGKEWEAVLTQFLAYKKEFDKLNAPIDATEEEIEKSIIIKDIFAWEQSVKAGPVIGKIKNHSMGTLLVSISEGEDLDTAVRKYESIVGDGYKRPNPVYTKKMYDDATKELKEQGLLDSLSRRHANLDDIAINNILFSNKDAIKRIQGTDIFAGMDNDIAVSPKKFSKTEEISIEDFIKNVLPTAKDIEVYLENKHANNMVSLIAPEIKDAKPLFKWDNPYSWAYSGNITDSSMKDRVKAAGGNVEGVLRFSIQWNDDEYDANDLDAHCIEPETEIRGKKIRNEIYFGNRKNFDTTGQLDIDITSPKRGTPSVENITWTNKSTMLKGDYDMFVNCWSNRGGRNGFKAEIEFAGQIYSFEYNKELRSGDNVKVAQVHFEGNEFTIKELLPSTTSSKDVWGLKTNQFVPAGVVMYSPNYWNEQNGIGHKHYFFMLKDCVNSEKPNGFYNEFLNQNLDKHKKFMEALGAKMAVKEIEDQLSGVGFSSTKRNDLIVKVKGTSERILKIKF
jgi:hypothetical protein